jgi:hypothetical protein
MTMTNEEIDRAVTAIFRKIIDGLRSARAEDQGLGPDAEAAYDSALSTVAFCIERSLPNA